MALFGKVANQTRESKHGFEVDRADELFIQNLSEQIVEDAAYSLGFTKQQETNMQQMSLENPYFNQEARDMLKFEINIALRNFGREKKIHLGHGLEKGQKSHPLTAFLKAHLFETVRKEMMAPTI